jgi:circadian clock protein KaiB
MRPSKKPTPSISDRSHENKSAQKPTTIHRFRLFVAGATDRSHRAVLNVRQLCEAEFKDFFTLEVIDIYQQPELARQYQIIVTPTLIKEIPKPTRRVLGNMANFSRLLLD